jgi:hypothetical protein
MCLSRYSAAIYGDVMPQLQGEIAELWMATSQYVWSTEPPRDKVRT